MPQKPRARNVVNNSYPTPLLPDRPPSFAQRQPARPRHRKGASKLLMPGQGAPKAPPAAFSTAGGAGDTGLGGGNVWPDKSLMEQRESPPIYEATLRTSPI